MPVENRDSANAVKVLSIDIGGSKLLTAIADVDVYSDGTRRAALSGISKRILNKDDGRNGVWNAILSAIEETLDRTHASLSDILKIGATIPGIADPKHAKWVYAPFSGISDWSIGSDLQREYGKEVRAENDVNACAWAEKIFGVCKDVDNFLWVTISNGIGGGLVLNGNIYPGKFAGAAEIGHFNVVENGRLCGCGNRGCLEATCAGPGIARNYCEALADKGSEIGRVDETPAISAAEIAALARQGDAIARQVYSDVGRRLGRALSWAANLINPEKIVIGGGVSGAFDLFSPSMQESFDSYLFKQTNKTLKIEKTGLGYEAGLYAAASLAWGSESSL